MSKQTDNEAIFLALKRILKSRKQTYSDLAKALKISEAGVKKMFLAKDCNIARLGEICRFLGISMRDLYEASERAPVPVVELSKTQTDFLATHPHYFHFFCKLVYEGASPEEIMKANRLSERSVQKYLKKLDDLNLIELHPGNKVKLTVTAFSKLRTKGTSLEKIKRASAAKFVEQLDPQGRHYRFGVVNYRMSLQKIQQFQVELTALLEKYRLQSELDRELFNRQDLEPVNVLIASGENSAAGEVSEL